MEIQQKIIDPRIHVVKVIGELDMYNAHELKNLVVKHCASHGGPLVIDMEELRNVDSSGVGVLIFAFTQSRGRGVPVWYANVRGSVRRVIELTSLLSFFPIVNGVEDAVEQARQV